MIRSYSFPNAARTFASACSMALRFAGWEKSVSGSLRNSVCVCVCINFLWGDLAVRRQGGEGDVFIVPEAAYPVVAGSLPDPVNLVVDGLQRKQIEGGNPARCEMRGGGDQVREKTKCPAA